ncbi:hypothetical protein [Burkholderia multivorans]|uniref:hypothetical protein n=1 Tax=Burkholderia multivorans TaxID=87883 RepID=UPI001C22CB09|nr:hypothetical protein [Burkholderia multivorans]
MTNSLFAVVDNARAHYIEPPASLPDVSGNAFPSETGERMRDTYMQSRKDPRAGLDRVAHP